MTMKTLNATDKTLVIPGIDRDENGDLMFADHAANDLAPARHLKSGLSDEDKDLDASIAKGWFGAIEGTEHGDFILVTYGRRRLLSARRVSEDGAANGKQPVRINVDVKKREKKSETIRKMIAENLGRMDLTIIEKAKQARKAIDDGGMKEADVAALFNVKKPTLRAWFKLLDADEALIQAAQLGRVSPQTALELARVAKADQIRATALTVAKGGSVAAGRAVITKMRAAKKGGAAPTTADDVRVMKRVATGKLQGTLAALLKEGDAHLNGSLDYDTAVAMLQWVIGIDEDAPGLLDNYIPQPGRGSDDGDAAKDDAKADKAA